MPYLTPERHKNLLVQIAINRGTWRQLPRSITGKRAHGPHAATFAQCEWAHALLEEMLREHVNPSDTVSPTAVRGPRVRAPRAPRPSRARGRDD